MVEREATAGRFPRPMTPGTGCGVVGWVEGEEEEAALVAVLVREEEEWDLG